MFIVIRIRDARRAARAGIRACAGVRGFLGWILLIAAVTLFAVPMAGADSATQAVPQGGAVYQQNCAACHGSAGEGMTGTGVEAGPSLVGLPVALVDLVVRTGRMPIVRPEAGVVESKLTADQRQDLIAWASDELSLVGSVPSIPRGTAARGQQLYGAYCAACHGATASGGVAGNATLVPPLVGLDRVAVAEAVRTGPFAMPAFSPDIVSDEDAGDIGAFLELLAASDTTPLGLREINAGVAGALVVFVAPLVVGIALLGARFRRRGGEENQG